MIDFFAAREWLLKSDAPQALYLLDIFDQFREQPSDEPKHLEKFFNITPKKIEKIIRGELFWKAAVFLQEKNNCSLYKATNFLIREIIRFKSTAWPLIKNGSREPRDQFEKILVELFSLDHKISVKITTLWPIIRDLDATKKSNFFHSE